MEHVEPELAHVQPFHEQSEYPSLYALYVGVEQDYPTNKQHLHCHNIPMLPSVLDNATREEDYVANMILKLDKDSVGCRFEDQDNKLSPRKTQ